MKESHPLLSLHEPLFEGNEWNYVKECINTGWVSSAGSFVNRFELAVADSLKIHHAVAVVNGTAALHLALRVIGVGAGDEVLVPSLTFIATVNSVVYLGAKPRFVDVEESTLGMNPTLVAQFLENEAELREDGHCYHRSSGRRIAACLPVHIHGHPTRIDFLLKICDQYRIPIVEDAAESLGSRFQEKATGSFGKIGCFSFNGNKIITTGGGGMVVTDDPYLATRIRHLSTQAKKDPIAFWHDDVGYNYRLPNLNAALGCAQMEQLPRILEKKRRIARWYKEMLLTIPRLSFISEPPESKSNYWLNTVKAETSELAATCLKLLNQNGFQSRPFWAPCHQQPMFKNLTHENNHLPITKSLWEKCFTLPSSSFLTAEDIERICEVLH